jgi:hypothetical protein
VDILQTNSIQGGANALYQFTIPPGLSAAEVRLDNVTGFPFMTLHTGSNAVSPNTTYGYDGGVGSTWSSATLITLPNPTATNYSLAVQAGPQSASSYPDAVFTVHLRQISSPNLVFDASLNSPGASNVVTGTLLDGQSAFYQVTVPASLNGQPVIGWRLDLAQTTGSPKVRVRPGAAPADGDPTTSAFAAGEAIIVPPYLTPGTWYVEVRATGLSTFTLTSSNLQFKHPAWAMPVQGNPVTTPGLPPGGPLFGDTGVDTNGAPLPGDQGIDLAQGTFDYYSVTVPPGNIGVMRTRLDAISGNPNLYIRVGGPPTLTHSATGGSGTLYDRTLNAATGSQYGNWVPINGRYEAYLTNGTWYMAVQAGGNSNVRYRMRVYTGIVTNLSFGGSYVGQTLAAGDWLYYSLSIPTNAPTNLNVTFSEQLGNVIMYVRDRVPPGNGASTSSSQYQDWTSDNKNHSSLYANYDPAGTYSFPTPPLRPGYTYYLGFRAVVDSTFSVSCNTNAGTIDYTNTVPFYGGNFNNSVPAHGILKLAIDVPADARRLIVNFTNVSAFNIYLDQGSVPAQDGTDPFRSLGTANPVINQPLYNFTWPWAPNYRYFLLVTNTSGSSQPFAFNVNGLNCATDDADADGLPDCWELTYWPSIYTYGPNDDPDGDGVRNLDEYLEGTDPTNPRSFHPRLQVTAQYGSVGLSPAGNPTTTPPKLWYNLGQMVQLTPTPSNGYAFLGWSGDVSGNANPLTITMNGHSNITAIFGISSPPTADYQFQNNLHSSIGNPPDLSNIAAGNNFVSDIVDGLPQTVYRFPQGSSVALSNANGVIPTNIYTIVLLFSFDNVSGWRRILDVKNPVSNNGLYTLNGQLYFYPTGPSGSSNIVAGNYAQVVMTRDASSNVVAYLNGVQQFSLVDNANYATLAGSPQLLRFFKDDTTEDASGTIARIRLYDKVMPPAQVATLDREVSGSAAPLRFVSPLYYSNHVMYLTLQVTPNVTYSVQASTNLVNWTTITNVTSSTPLVLISDSQASTLPRRMYRGVTQASSTVSAPTVTTQPATSVGVNSATLNASINPNGASTSYYFQYGTTLGYGSFSPTNILAAGFSPVGVNAPVSPLLQNTNYHFRAVATNSSGLTLGSDMLFTTLKQPAIANVTNLPNHQISMRFTGTTNATYSIQTSTNLTSWTVLSNVTMNASGSFQFLETNFASAPRRFYRLSWP